MKCICGHDFDGNFCPYCGRSAGNMQNQTNNISNINLNNSSDSEEKESGSKILREAYHESKMARLKWMFIGMFLVAIIAFPMGHTISGITFAIAGILAMPWLIKKAGSKKVLLIIGSAILVLIGIFTWYWDDALREEGCIEYIKTYPMATADYTIEDFFGFAYSEDELDWSYEKVDDKEYVTVSFTEPDGVDESVIFGFNSDGYPVLHDVIYDGKSNESLFEDYNSRLFGESGTKQDKTEESVVTTEQQTVNTTEAAEEKSEKADVSSDVYYLMETIDQDPYWSVQVKNARVRARNDGQGLEVHCTVYVYNKDEMTLSFVSSDIFSDVDNDGVACKRIWSDWEIGNFAGETGSNVEVVFDFPANANEDTSRISMTVCGKYKLCLATRPGSDVTQDESVSYNENDLYWYTNYSAMYTQVGNGSNLQVVNMSDRYLQLMYSGYTLSWSFELIPDYINENGVFIYYSDGAMLTYNPQYERIYLAISDRDLFNEYGGIYDKSEYEYTP